MKLTTLSFLAVWCIAINHCSDIIPDVTQEGLNKLREAATYLEAEVNPNYQDAKHRMTDEDRYIYPAVEIYSRVPSEFISATENLCTSGENVSPSNEMILRITHYVELVRQYYGLYLEIMAESTNTK